MWDALLINWDNIFIVDTHHNEREAINREVENIFYLIPENLQVRKD